jgi:hypothetical protein
VGLETRDQETERFLDLADRLGAREERAEQQRLKEELAHLTFGD